MTRTMARLCRGGAGVTGEATGWRGARGAGRGWADVPDPGKGRLGPRPFSRSIHEAPRPPRKKPTTGPIYTRTRRAWPAPRTVGEFPPPFRGRKRLEGGPPKKENEPHECDGDTETTPRVPRLKPGQGLRDRNRRRHSSLCCRLDGSPEYLQRKIWLEKGAASTPTRRFGEVRPGRPRVRGSASGCRVTGAATGWRRARVEAGGRRPRHRPGVGDEIARLTDLLGPRHPGRSQPRVPFPPESVGPPPGLSGNSPLRSAVRSASKVGPRRKGMSPTNARAARKRLQGFQGRNQGRDFGTERKGMSPTNATAARKRLQGF